MTSHSNGLRVALLACPAIARLSQNLHLYVLRAVTAGEAEGPIRSRSRYGRKRYISFSATIGQWGKTLHSVPDCRGAGRIPMSYMDRMPPRKSTADSNWSVTVITSTDLSCSQPGGGNKYTVRRTYLMLRHHHSHTEGSKCVVRRTYLKLRHHETRGGGEQVCCAQNIPEVASS
jgi:hypothetical protein